MSAKVWAVIAALIAVLAIAVTRLSKPGADYSLSVKEYECNVEITTNPQAFRQDVLAQVTFSCKTAPRTTDLVLMLQHKNAAGTWVDAGAVKEFTGSPPATKVAMNVSTVCSAGDWRAGYHFTGTGAATGKPFAIEPKFGNSVSISAGDCANS